MHAWGHTYYCQGRWLLKVVRSRSDQGLRFTDQDQSKETENRALISAITCLFDYKDIPYTVVSQSMRVCLYKTGPSIRLSLINHTPIEE